MVEQGFCIVWFELTIASLAHCVVILVLRGYDGSIEIRLCLDNREQILAVVVAILW